MPLQRVRAATIGLAWAVVITTGGHAGSADLFDEIYQRGRPIESTLRTLTARFTETTTSSLLSRPLVARGTLAVARPDRIVLRYDAPDSRTVLIDGDVMRLVWPARGLDQRTNVGAAQRRVQQYFVDKTPDQLRSHFEIQAEAPGDQPALWRVRMTPKRRQIREGVSQLDLWLDRATVTLTAMRITFPNRDTKLMEFEDVRINPAIDPSLFQIR
jgi:outer membrane lipoprotein-sorting protein